jgi:hypothetical protein
MSTQSPPRVRRFALSTTGPRPEWKTQRNHYTIIENNQAELVEIKEERQALRVQNTELQDEIFVRELLKCMNSLELACCGCSARKR